MISKVIKFEDFDGNPTEETHWFHLSKSELVVKDLSHPGGWEKHLKALVAEADTNPMPLVNEFRELILEAHGEKSEDGRHFEKTSLDRIRFEHSLAFDALFIQIATDHAFAMEFVNGLVPKDLAETAAKIQSAELPEPSPQEEDNVPAWVREDREPTKQELQRMTPAQLREAFAARSSR